MRLAFFSLSCVLALAGPVAAQTIQPALELSGTPADGGAPTPGSRAYAPGTDVDVTPSVTNAGRQPLALDFADPSDAAEVWIADAWGDYVVGYALSGNAHESLQPGGGRVDWPFTWDQTDWYGQPLTAGVYSMELVVNAGAPGPFSVDKIYFEVGDAPSDPADFSARLVLPRRTFLRGSVIPLRLDLTNLMSDAEALELSNPKQNVEISVLDASGAVVATGGGKAATGPVRAGGPTQDFFAPGEKKQFPLTWASTALPAGRYTIVATVLSMPSHVEARATVTLTGPAGPIAEIDLGDEDPPVPVYSRASALSPAIAQLGDASRVIVLWQGTRWAKVMMSSGTTGYVEKAKLNVLP